MVEINYRKNITGKRRKSKFQGDWRDNCEKVLNMHPYDSLRDC